MSPPRLGFVGLGWIGAMRLEAVGASGRAEVVALCDRDADRLHAAGEAHRSAERFDDYAELLRHAADLRLDAVVLATPNALHGPQTLAALENGLAVFCQKPLAMNAAEARTMVDAARSADRLLAVDYSYRYTHGARALWRLARSGDLGTIFTIDTVFHNAYGPDKDWCYDPAAAGGGALLDLGVHQVDLALWILDFPAVEAVHGRVFRQGQPVAGRPSIDDFATAHLQLEGGAVINLAVSWHSHAGSDCVIRTTIFGTAAGAEFRNIGGSFLDFEVARFSGRVGEVVGRESREWLGRAILAWIDRLAESPAFDPEIERSIIVTTVTDEIYGAG